MGEKNCHSDSSKWNANPSDGLSANNGFQNNVAKLKLFNLYGET